MQKKHPRVIHKILGVVYSFWKGIDKLFETIYRTPMIIYLHL